MIYASSGLSTLYNWRASSFNRFVGCSLVKDGEVIILYYSLPRTFSVVISAELYSQFKALMCAPTLINRRLYSSDSFPAFNALCDDAFKHAKKYPIAEEMLKTGTSRTKSKRSRGSLLTLAFLKTKTEKNGGKRKLQRLCLDVSDPVYLTRKIT